ncbi:hypothetical protein GQ600_22253 [Phytophthora cactorum]|nr:hypothetical protein GQ600_22253 [Phytophthora cactorum]
MNTMADAGSRAGTHPPDKSWANLSSTWSPVSIYPALRKIYMIFLTNFRHTHWSQDSDQGAESTRFGTHYRSSGGATAMLSADVDTLTIKLFGIWLSDAFERYTRMNGTVTKHPAGHMTRGARSRASPVNPECFVQPPSNLDLLTRDNTTRLRQHRSRIMENKVFVKLYTNQ